MLPMTHACRHCGTPLGHTVLDLGNQPPSNAYLSVEQLSTPEITYPLQVYVCTSCWLVQLPAHASADELFTADYAYFSSTSSSWCAHAKRFASEAVERLCLGKNSYVVELASNDGYLLQYFKELGIPCLGIEPTRATAEASRAKGIETLERFFGLNLAQELDKADLIVANNVLAHVPDINDFLEGVAFLLKPKGRASLEFPHLLRLLEGNQFDTIYHEHYSYLSLGVVQRIANSCGLSVVDVEQLPTHGGSLRVWLAHPDQAQPSSKVLDILANVNFQANAKRARDNLLEFLITAKRNGKLVLGYGAAAKGNTLLNYAGVRSELLSAVADRALSKQGRYLPYSHIPIINPEMIASYKPDYMLVLLWNLIDELRQQIPDINLVTAIPDLTHWPKIK